LGLIRLSESCFNNSIFLALFDVYSCKYTKIAVKIPQNTKEIAAFLPQNMNIASKIPFDAGFHLIIISPA